MLQCSIFNDLKSLKTKEKMKDVLISWWKHLYKDIFEGVITGKTDIWLGMFEYYLHLK